MGVNWVSLAPNSVGWLVWTFGLLDGGWRLQSSRMGKVCKLGARLGLGCSRAPAPALLGSGWVDGCTLVPPGGPGPPLGNCDSMFAGGTGVRAGRRGGGSTFPCGRISLPKLSRATTRWGTRWGSRWGSRWATDGWATDAVPPGGCLLKMRPSVPTLRQEYTREKWSEIAECWPGLMSRPNPKPPITIESINRVIINKSTRQLVNHFFFFLFFITAGSPTNLQFSQPSQASQSVCSLQSAVCTPFGRTPIPYLNLARLILIRQV